jgi:hypothetical protein
LLLTADKEIEEIVVKRGETWEREKSRKRRNLGERGVGIEGRGFEKRL